MHQPLTDKPLVGRRKEVAPKLLLERGHTAIAARSQLLDGYVAEYVTINELLEILARGINIRKHLAFQTAVHTGHDEVYEFGHLDVLGCGVVREQLIAQVLVERHKEVACGAPRGSHDVVQLATRRTRVVVHHVEIVVHTQIGEYLPQVLGRVVARNLLVGMLFALGHIFGVVVSLGQKIYLATLHLVTGVTIIYILGAAEYITNGVTREIMRLNTVGIWLRKLDYHWL